MKTTQWKHPLDKSTGGSRRKSRAASVVATSANTTAPAAASMHAPQDLPEINSPAGVAHGAARAGRGTRSRTWVL